MLRYATLPILAFAVSTAWGQATFVPPNLTAAAAGSPNQPASPAPSDAPDSFVKLMAEHADDAPPLLGHVSVDTYYAPSGAFSVPIPVLLALHGNVTDADHLVTFEDPFTTHITIANFPMDATQRWELSTDTPKDYLVGFFEKYVLANYREVFKGVPIRVEENARYLPGMYGGSFIVYLDIPGGTNFGDRIPRVDVNAPPRVAKYGVLLFTRNNFIFIISMELAEHAIEGSAYHVSEEKENLTLRARLLDLASQMEFYKPPADATH